MRTTTTLSMLIAAMVFTLASSGCGSGETGADPTKLSIPGGTPKAGGANSIAPPPAPIDPNRYSDADIASPTDSESYQTSNSDDPRRYDGPDLRKRAGGARDDEKARLASENPTVVVKTSLGEFQIRLDPESSPITVENFLEYVRSGFYSGTIFHQAENGFIVSAGEYQPNLKPKRTRIPIRNEAHNGRRNLRGTVAMVRYDGVNSATSAFLINLIDNASRDHRSRAIAPAGQRDKYGYCVFGEIVAGWDVVQRIARSRVRPTGQFKTLPTETITIVSAEILPSRPAPQPKSKTGEVSSASSGLQIK